MADQNRRAVSREFAQRWSGRGYEKGDTQQYWLQLLRTIGYQYADVVLFEHRVASGGFIDAWIREADVLIEQKGEGVDLDKPELRQGKMKNPLEQALDYVDELPRPEQPRFVITCNFGTFRVYDRDKYGRSELAGHAFEFTLAEFGEHPEYLAFIVDPANSRFEKEKQVSVQAGEQIGRLYDLLKTGYRDPDSDESMHALNVLCVRLVFCLYCEDADLFPKDAFFKYLRDVPPQNIRVQLQRLFAALDTPIPERDPYDTDLKPFPYVNGGLFRGDVEIPNFTEETKQFLLNDVSVQVNWSQISPTIFGGIFESTMNPETRRSGGMHYTSPEYIHKVIDPLFLDALKEQFRAIRDAEGITPRQRKNRLTRLHQHICGLKFLDPACGSGNFLTETYLSLRKLEDAILYEVKGGQEEFGAPSPDVDGSHVSLAQFYGIEINDFAVTVAETALWISRLKANGETSMLYNGGDEDFPLHERAQIIHGNALRMDWNDVLPAHDCAYIMGNPPFVGHQYRSAAQQEDMDAAFSGWEKYGKLDYVAAWYAKAISYIGAREIRSAFVSTNSICQGEGVKILWEPVFRAGFAIMFAHQTFVWANDAATQAHVHVVIVGFARNADGPKLLFGRDGPVQVENINGYLAPAPNVFIESRGRPCNPGMPEMTKGSQPTDGGYLILSEEEAEALLFKYPALRSVIRRYVGGKEFINDIVRYCLWFTEENVLDFEAIPEIRERLNAVAETRRASPTASVRRDAETPWRFTQIRQPETDYLAVPEVSSERRQYIPVGFMSKDVIASNQLRFIPTDSLFVFGILVSSYHMAWMRVVSGRLEMRYRYSPAVWNCFVFPDASDAQRAVIETCAQAVLDARANHPGDSLATLYDPDRMPADLLAAHRALDEAVETAYGVDFQGDEEKITAHLFRLYAQRINQT